MWRNGSGLVVAFVLAVVAACGGNDTTSSTDGASGGSDAVGGETWSVAEVAPSVEFFGDLAVVRSAPVTTTFDASAASLELDDAVIVGVPAGAFEAPTEVTAVVVDLDFARYADNAPQAVAYVLSTEADVDLGVPVVLEVPEPSDTVSVLQPIDGEWRLVEVPSGPTTRIPITHFSEVPTVVAEPGISNAVIRGSDPDGEAPGDFLTACLYTVTILLADDPDVAGTQDASLSLPLAYSFCARALVTKFSPSGVRVEVSCVGDKIGGDVDFLAAIDACAAEETAPVSEPRPDEAAADPAADVAPTGDPPAAGDFPRTYRGEGTYYLTDFAYDVPFGCEATGPMELTLDATGTATFTFHNGVGVRATISGDGEPQIECEEIAGNTWTGTYDAGLSTFEILPPTPEGFESWEIGGIFDTGTADVLGGYGLPPNPAGQQRIIEIEASLTT